MWILIRLVMAAAAFVAAQARKIRWNRNPDGQIHGFPYFVQIHKHKRDVKGFTIGVKLERSIWFCVDHESQSDRWFKRIGLATEFQTGDAKFDKRYYIACDHPLLHQHLEQNQEVRAAITAAFRAGFDQVSGDGRYLWMHKVLKEPPRPKDLEPLAVLARAFESLPRNPNVHFWTDRFFWRVCLVESLVWSIFGYGVASFASWHNNVDIHLHGTQLILPGLGVAVILLALLMAVVVGILRGSSRGHRVIVESAVFLCLALPIAGIQTVGDLNRALDRASPVTVSADAIDCERVRRRRSTTHYVQLENSAELTKHNVPLRIRVDRQVCGAGKMQFTIGPGRFGFPWYRRIRNGPRVWIGN